MGDEKLEGLRPVGAASPVDLGDPQARLGGPLPVAGPQKDPGRDAGQLAGLLESRPGDLQKRGRLADLAVAKFLVGDQPVGQRIGLRRVEQRGEQPLGRRPAGGLHRREAAPGDEQRADRRTEHPAPASLEPPPPGDDAPADRHPEAHRRQVRVGIGGEPRKRHQVAVREIRDGQKCDGHRARASGPDEPAGGGGSERERDAPDHRRRIDAGDELQMVGRLQVEGNQVVAQVQPRRLRHQQPRVHRRELLVHRLEVRLPQKPARQHPAAGDQTDEQSAARQDAPAPARRVREISADEQERPQDRRGRLAGDGDEQTGGDQAPPPPRPSGDPPLGSVHRRQDAGRQQQFVQIRRPGDRLAGDRVERPDGRTGEPDPPVRRPAAGEAVDEQNVRQV